MTAGYIRKVATEVLGVLRGTFGRRQSDWWWNNEVQGKVKDKKVAYTERLEFRDEDEKQKLKVIYKTAKSEAKTAVAIANSQRLSAFMRS